MMKKYNLAIMASGNGSNAENLIRFFKDSDEINVGFVLSNKKSAYVIERAKNHKVPHQVFNRAQLIENESEYVVSILEKHQIDYLILAGFLLKIPQAVIDRFPDKIINIHPSLLPEYGGKGMFGAHVHEAVIAAKEKVSGITIHLVNKEYDKGKILFQAKCKIDAEDSPEDLARKIHQLEYRHFPEVIQDYIKE
ncbi:MAG: phosphoribosylglycinamide formyltransferase [Cyclobacteriaceae bacterium]